MTVGDWVEHIHYTWHGPMKIISINFGTATLLTNLSSELYYNISNLRPTNQPDDLTPYYRNMDSLGMNYEPKKEIDPLFCSCSRSEAEIVESSIQVHRNMDNHEKFKFCRTCKKEAK